MKDFFIDIFNYHHTFNQKLIDQINAHIQTIPDETYALFCHVLNAYQVWNSRILQLTPFGVQQIHHLEDCKAIDDTNFINTLNILNAVDLKSEITYKNSKGEKFTNSVQDILFHVNNHSTHHKAQLASKFRSLGITPLATDFIFYKR